MRILTGQGVTHTLLQSAPDELQEASRDERVQGAPGGTDGGIEPNRQFPDLFLRFVSSVAQFEHQAQRPGGPQTLAAVDLSAVTSKYIGETEKNVDAAFQRAETAGSTLSMDEADALFGRRTDVTDSHDRYAKREAARRWPWE